MALPMFAPALPPPPLIFDRSHNMADLENWISLFRAKQDQKTYDFIFQTLVTNQFTSRLQLKLLTSEQLDYMFSMDLVRRSRISCRFTEG